MSNQYFFFVFLCNILISIEGTFEGFIEHNPARARRAESCSSSPVCCVKTSYGIASSQLSCRCRQARYPGSQGYGYRRQRWSWPNVLRGRRRRLRASATDDDFHFRRIFTSPPRHAFRCASLPSPLPSLLLSARSTRTCVIYYFTVTHLTGSLHLNFLNSSSPKAGSPSRSAQRTASRRQHSRVDLSRLEVSSHVSSAHLVVAT